MKRRLACVFAAAAVALSPAIGSAQDPEPEATNASPSRDEEARSLYEAGRAAFESGDLERALEHFERSYQLSMRPELLFNMANVQDRLGHDADALRSFESYVDLAPEDAPAVAFANGRIAALTERLRPPAEPSAGEGWSDLEVGAVVALAAGGALVVGAVTTLVFWMERDDRIAECNVVGCSNGETIVAERDLTATLTFTFGGVGLASIATGLVLWMVARDTSTDAQAGVRCAPSVAGIGCDGWF